MRHIKIITLSVVLMALFSISATFAGSFPSFLVGTWKVENQNTYEQWDRQDSHHLKGVGYKINDGQKVITEYLDIKYVGKDIIYSATVLSQNDGKTITFTLNHRNGNIFSFENPRHDFPKKIIYQKISDDEIFIEVTGAADKGFSYNMKRKQN